MSNMNGLTISDSWERIFDGEAKSALEAILPGYMRARRWFGGKARTIQSAEITQSVRMPGGLSGVYIAFVQVRYAEGDTETYVLPLTFASEERAAQVRENAPHAVVS